MIHVSQLFRLSEQQISTSLAGESVILNHQKGMYYSLNEVGTLVWEFIEKQKQVSFGELVQVVIESYDIDEETCKNDLEILLTDLLNEKLLEKVG